MYGSTVRPTVLAEWTSAKVNLFKLHGVGVWKQLVSLVVFDWSC